MDLPLPFPPDVEPMDFSLPGFASDVDLLQTDQQAYEPYSLDDHLTLILQAQAPSAGHTLSQDDASHSLCPSEVPVSHEIDSVEHSVNAESRIPKSTTSKVLQATLRKQRAPNLSLEDWERHKNRILTLYNEQGMSLQLVKQKIEAETGFPAE